MGAFPFFSAILKIKKRGVSRGAKQFHDCGIVYHPANPYLLCVMGRGEDFWELTKSVADVSRIVYEEVERQTGSRPDRAMYGGGSWK